MRTRHAVTLSKTSRRWYFNSKRGRKRSFLSEHEIIQCEGVFVYVGTFLNNFRWVNVDNDIVIDCILYKATNIMLHSTTYGAAQQGSGLKYANGKLVFTRGIYTAVVIVSA